MRIKLTIVANCCARRANKSSIPGRVPNRLVHRNLNDNNCVFFSPVVSRFIVTWSVTVSLLLVTPADPPSARGKPTAPSSHVRCSRTVGLAVYRCRKISQIGLLFFKRTVYERKKKLWEPKGQCSCLPWVVFNSFNSNEGQTSTTSLFRNLVNSRTHSNSHLNMRISFFKAINSKV